MRMTYSPGASGGLRSVAMADEENAPAGLSRRSVLKRGAVVGGAVVWTVPIVESITHKAAAASPVTPLKKVTITDEDTGKQVTCDASVVPGSNPTQYVISSCVEVTG